MTDTTNTAATAKAKTVADDMDARSIFDSLEAAEQFLGACSTRYADWADQTVVAPALLKDADGNATGFDPEVYGNDSNEIMVATLKNKGKNGQASTMKAIVIAPIPTLDALLGNDAGRTFVAEIVRKELNHRAVRTLRVAEDVTTVADQIPFTLDAFISSSRESSGILETFNEVYKAINASLSKVRPAWARAKLSKNELRKALESKGYATEYYAALEDTKDGSLFEAAIKLGINAAKRQGLDPTIFERWQNSRNEKAFTADEDEEDELDLDALTDSMLADDTDEPVESGETEEAPATEPAN